MFDTITPGVRPTFYKAKGCDRCSNTGFLGRRGIYELLLIDDTSGRSSCADADAQAIKRAAQDMGMDTLRDDGARKVLAGLTTVEEVLAATQEDVDARRGPRVRGSAGRHVARRTGRPEEPWPSSSTAAPRHQRQAGARRS